MILRHGSRSVEARLRYALEPTASPPVGAPRPTREGDRGLEGVTGHHLWRPKPNAVPEGSDRGAGVKRAKRARGRRPLVRGAQPLGPSCQYKDKSPRRPSGAATSRETVHWPGTETGG